MLYCKPLPAFAYPPFAFSPPQTCNRLIHEAIRERKCTDNCTVLLLRFDHSRPASH